MVFSAPGGRWYHAPRSEGGVGHHSDKKCGKAAFLYLSHFAVLIYYESTRPASDAGERLGRERPPPKPGGHVTLIAVLRGIPLSRPHGGRSRPHLSLREGSEQPPRSGAESTETDL